MLQFPRWRVDVTVGNDLVKTLYETATTSKAAIAKAKHKLRGAVSSAGAFKFKATKVEAEETKQHHATKKSAVTKDGMLRNISTPHEEKYQTWDGNVTVARFKRGLWSVLPRGHAPFMVPSKREAFDQALGIAARHWGLPKEVAFPTRRAKK